MEPAVELIELPLIQSRKFSTRTMLGIAVADKAMSPAHGVRLLENLLLSGIVDPVVSKVFSCFGLPEGAEQRMQFF
ncbi:hypothetical protein KOR42_04500 [Thalassoglobus neptunius]|uniref:Uncharacterized protein n=1 Tax=Thalassoglobus neptunius TaxID=1938619 RepID=A0A5C5X4N6_9PLAN|nr:hypothetical protein KOR42_04500 [Thalassoglobus neptunius]